MPKYQTIKTFGNDRGLSCAFRQWRATHSHCKENHGYALGAEFVLECETLDDRNWCYDYGSFKEVKKFLEENFDHKTCVAADDPELEWFKEGEARGTLKLNIFDDGVGCEKFAEYIYNYADKHITTITNGRVKLISVKVFEHGANAAVYFG